MSLSDISIKNPVFAWMLMAAMIVFGGISYTRLGVSQMPEIDFPVLTVSVTWEGAAPEVMESDVTDVIEDAVMSSQGLREVSSTTRQGSTDVKLEFDLSRDIDVALQEVQSRVSQAQRRLPEDIDPPIVSKQNPTDNPIMWLGLSGERPLRDMITYVQDHLKDRFQTIPGVGEIILSGYVDRNLRVWVSNKKLDEYQLTVSDVTDAIERNRAVLPRNPLAGARLDQHRVPGAGQLLDADRDHGDAVFVGFHFLGNADNHACISGTAARRADW